MYFARTMSMDDAITKMRDYAKVARSIDYESSDGLEIGFTDPETTSLKIVPITPASVSAKDYISHRVFEMSF